MSVPHPRRQHSTTSGSTQSHSTEDNETHDSFSRKMMQEMRAEAAANWRANNTRPVAFSRARQPRIRPKVELTVENVERVTLTNGTHTEVRDRNVERFEREASVTSSGGSRGSDPPLNVPRTWARKARRDNAWLKRLAAEINPVEATPMPRDDIVDWEEAAIEQELPTTEDSPSSRRGSRRGTPAAAPAIRPDMSPDELRRREFDQDSTQDFTLGSVITSTPAVISRNTRLEELRQQELDDTLDDLVDDSIYPTPPPDVDHKVIPTRTSAQSETAFSHVAEREIDPAKKTFKPDARPGSSRRRPLFEPPKSPVATLKKSSSVVGVVDRQVLPEVQKSPERPLHKRQDSRDLLRQWSRAASGTPSPGRIVRSHSEELNVIVADVAEPEDPEISAAIDAISKTLGRQPGTESRPADKENIRPVSAPSQRTTSKSRERTADPPASVRSLSPIKISREPKTPIVTGAWVDTPAATTKKSVVTVESRSRTGSESTTVKETTTVKEDTAIKPPEPNSNTTTKTRRSQFLPRSALSTLVHRARSSEHHPETTPYDPLGDETIASLEDIIRAPADTTILDNLDPGEDETLLKDLDDRIAKGKEATTAAGKLRAQEARSLRDMTLRLAAARRGMRDAGVGIGRVEVLVGMKGRDGGLGGLRRGEVGESSKESLEGPRFAQRPFTTLGRGIRSMFLTEPGKGIRGSRWTWFGLLTTISLAWLLTESLACLTFCRPLFATPGTNPTNPYNLYPHAPEFPLVLPTMTYQALHYIPGLSQLLDLLGFLLNATVGTVWRGFVLPPWRWFYQDRDVGLMMAIRTLADDGGRGLTEAITSTFTEEYWAGGQTAAARVVRDSFAEEGGWGMGGDEYI